jgi:hypothetical protein
MTRVKEQLTGRLNFLREKEEELKERKGLLDDALDAVHEAAEPRHTREARAGTYSESPSDLYGSRVSRRRTCVRPRSPGMTVKG